VPHVAVKPQLAGIETNLTIYTTRHIYHLLLRSRGRAMQEVEFYYPDDLLAAIAAAGQAHAGAEREAAAADPARLNFAYEIDGPNVRWRPERVYDDGSHVYLRMAPGMKTSEAPALLVKAAGGTQMINYRVVGGGAYVTDELFNQAVMMEGVGREQDRVTITYSGASR
jgi:type IV secretion system protein VirB9